MSSHSESKTVSESKTAVVIGAGGGIGQAICKTFAYADYTIYALDKNENAAAASTSDLNGDHYHAALDVTDIDDVQAMASDIWADHSVDAVIYAPGVVFTANLANMPWQKYRNLMRVNLDGAFYVGQAFVQPMLAATRPGSFVFLSSMAGKRGEAGASAYCASKFGIIGLTQSFAAEVAVQDIRVNAICPGNVDTPMLRRVAKDIASNQARPEADVWQELANVAAAKRLVTPAEIAETCLWLCSPAASGITGEAINVDAGALSG
jgi:NAD(P)-dependent dehydrogenase (short-subunit alcohol dehydrogenase family)